VPRIAHAIEKAARQAKIQVLVNYETTWYRSNHAAYDLVRQNAIGEIRKIVVHDGHQGPKEIGVGPEFLGWLTDPKLDGGGALYDFGCYGADLATWMMDDEATIILTYPRAQAIIQASWNWPFGRKDMEVYGQTGYVITVRNDDLRVRLAKKDEEQVTGQPLAAPFDDSLSLLRAVVLGGVAPDPLSSLATNVIVSEILTRHGARRLRENPWAWRVVGCRLRKRVRRGTEATGAVSLAPRRGLRARARCRGTLVPKVPQSA